MNSENNTNPRSEENSGIDESSKAFNWAWSDEKGESEGNQGEPDSNEPGGSNETEGQDNSKDEFENKIENNTDTECVTHLSDADAQAPDSEGECAQNEDNEENTTDNGLETQDSPSKPSSKKFSPSTLPIISIILSSCAITLLISFAIYFFVDMAISKNREVVYLQVSQGDDVSDQALATSQMLEDCMNSVVIVNAQTALGKNTGTGIIISKDGYIVTNHHVIEGAQSVYVWLYGEKEAVDAKIIGFSEKDDIAVIKIQGENYRAATFAKSANCKIGERVYAIGTPEGSEFGWSVSMGIISSPNREIKMYDNQGVLKKKMNVIQTDAPVNQGNSGGPLINSRGEVVGIITLKLSDSAGMGFAIPSDGALIDVSAIISTGNADSVNSGIAYGRPLIGITGVGVEKEGWYRALVDGTVQKLENEAIANKFTDSFYAPISGVYVMQTSRGLDAETKVKPGDIITEINGVKVYTIYQVMAIINEFNGGDQITIKLYRNSKYTEVSVTLGVENITE